MDSLSGTRPRDSKRESVVGEGGSPNGEIRNEDYSTSYVPSTCSGAIEAGEFALCSPSPRVLVFPTSQAGLGARQVQETRPPSFC